MDFKQDAIWPGRSAGTIIPILSLDSAYGCGDIEAACRMIDYLSDCGMTTMMLLPLHPIGFGNSPYAPQSSVGGCLYFISPDWLCRDGLVTKKDCSELAKAEQSAQKTIDYGILYKTRTPFLKNAFDAFEQDEHNAQTLDEFINGYQHLHDTVLFLCIKETQNGRPWWEWDNGGLKMPDAASIDVFKQQNAKLMRFYWFVQYLFHTQMRELRDHAQRMHMNLVGDMPFYMAPDSADVWRERHLFAVDPCTGEVLMSGGAPASNMADGPQIWGNPIYNWDEQRTEVLAWWKERLHWYAQYFSGLRVDHATALKRYYCISPDGSVAEWHDSPFDELCALISVFSQQNTMQILCEDLGEVPDGLRERFAQLGWFQMRAIQYANITKFDASDESLPANYFENMVAFTGTHDNLPVKAYFHQMNIDELLLAWAKAGLDANNVDDLFWAIIDTIYQSRAKLCVIQLQDLLELGRESSLIDGCQPECAWSWRMPAYLLTSDRARKFKNFAVASNRL